MGAILRKPPGVESRIWGCGNLDVRAISKLLNVNVFQERLKHLPR